MAKQAEDYEDISQVEVKLKPILGIQPGLYLTVLYALAALFLLFLLLFLPGIRKNGTVYRFISSPAGSAVYVDGRYAGSTPAKAFVPEGSHDLRIERPHFVPVSRKLNTEGRLFGSLIFPRRATVDLSMKLQNETAFLASRYIEMSEWALVSQFGPSYQAPPLISATVSDYFRGGGDDTDLVDHFLESSLSSINGPILMAEFAKALALRYSSGNPATPLSLLQTLRGAVDLIKDYPGLALLIPAAINEDAIPEYRGSEWFSSVVAGYRAGLDGLDDAVSRSSPDERLISGLPFVYIPAGSFAMAMPVGNESTSELPHPAATEAFYILKGEVTRGWYRRFLSENSDWVVSNREELVAQGVVNDDYLYSWDEEVDKDLPQGYVSYYAAQAFAEWFGKQLPDAWAGFSARLPTEVEWERTARLFPGQNFEDRRLDGPTPIQGDIGAEYMLGGLWEWTATWFQPADYFLYPWTATPGNTGPAYEEFATAAEVVVRGGSWANSEDDRITAMSRGSQPPDWCSPFTGFRIVLMRE